MTLKDETIKLVIDSFKNFDFEADRLKRAEEVKARHAAHQAILEAGPEVESTLPCMRSWCDEKRWTVPTSSSVLCREHTLEVFRGEAKAPPLRHCLDYISTSRKTFLVETLPDIDKGK